MGLTRGIEALTADHVEASGHPTDVVPDLFDWQRFGTPRWAETETRTAIFRHDWPGWRRRDTPRGLPIPEESAVRFTPPAYCAIPDRAAFLDAHLAALRSGMPTGVHEPIPRREASGPDRPRSRDWPSGRDTRRSRE
jgi:hypothetical protein